jgi:RNA polymerase subunit RPABC4/transcription elongation factor Spt4
MRVNGIKADCKVCHTQATTLVSHPQYDIHEHWRCDDCTEQWIGYCIIIEEMVEPKWKQ